MIKASRRQFIDSGRAKTVTRLGPKLAGIDGCKLGWFIVTQTGQPSAIQWCVAPNFETTLSRLSASDVIAVDIPIGLPDSGPRQCGKLARKLLGREKGSSVFPAPLRSVFGAATHDEASNRRERIEGKRMSIQAFSILKKIEQVDDAVRALGQQSSGVYEIHPEVSFYALADGTPLSSKKARLDGRRERIKLLRREFPIQVMEAALRAYPVKQVAKDDVLDAFVALWSARRISGSMAKRLPLVPELDSDSLDMAIWY